MNGKSDAIMQNCTMAVTKALLGNRRMKDGVMIVAGDMLDADGRVHLGQMANDNQTDFVHLGFGDDGDGNRRMTRITLVMPRDPICYNQTDCRFWMSPTGNRAIIVPRPEVRGHFRLAPREIVHVGGKPSGDRDVGIARAEAWIERWSRTPGPVPANANFYDVANAA